MPPDTTRAPTLVPGELEVGFTEWKVPTLGQRARDPVEAPDGTIWWAGQWGNLIGRIDPRTGEMKEYPLPDGAMPHSVTIDDAGMVWYTGNQNGSVGKFNPTTEEITVYPMPDPAARDRDVPELGDPVRQCLWRHRPAHADDPRRQPADPSGQHQPHHPGDAAANACDQVGPTVLRLARLLCGRAGGSRQPLLAHTPSVAASPFTKSITKSDRRFVSR